MARGRAVLRMNVPNARERESLAGVRHRSTAPHRLSVLSGVPPTGQHGYMADLLGGQAGDGQVRLSGLLRVHGDIMQQERSTGDRLKTHAIAGRRTLLRRHLGNGSHGVGSRIPARAPIFLNRSLCLTV